MRTLKNHTILFDAECPMCNVYTKAFVRSGMLDSKEGRKAYQQAGENCKNVDMQRAVNEIALINGNTGEVTYGVKSLFKVLANSFPLLEPVFRFRPFSWLMEKLYAFISYNRRVIIPGNTQIAASEWQPSFRLHYRLIFLLFTGLMSAAILSHYTPLLYPLLPRGSSYREYLVCFGQIAVQGIIATIFFPKKVWNYLGNMMTISFVGALLLLPVIIASEWIFLMPQFALIYFMFIVSLMLLEHVRRTRILGINWALTISWIIYRIVILLIIFKSAGYALF